MTQILTLQSAPAEANLPGDKNLRAAMPPTFARSKTIFFEGPPSTSHTMIFESSPAQEAVGELGKMGKAFGLSLNFFCTSSPLGP
jgi:hypothetical protein